MKTSVSIMAVVLALASPAFGQSGSKYEISTTWAQFPAGVEWGPVIAVAFDLVHGRYPTREQRD